MTFQQTYKDIGSAGFAAARYLSDLETTFGQFIGSPRPMCCDAICPAPKVLKSVARVIFIWPLVCLLKYSYEMAHLICTSRFALFPYISLPYHSHFYPSGVGPLYCRNDPREYWLAGYSGLFDYSVLPLSLYHACSRHFENRCGAYMWPCEVLWRATLLTLIIWDSNCEQEAPLTLLSMSTRERMEYEAVEPLHSRG